MQYIQFAAFYDLTTRFIYTSVVLWPAVKMVARVTPVTSNAPRPWDGIGWLIEASECMEGEGRGDRPVIDTDEREETRMGAKQRRGQDTKTIAS